jgi:hypothetical protein
MGDKVLGHTSLGTDAFSSTKTLLIQVDIDLSSQKKLKFGYKHMIRRGNPDDIPDWAEFAGASTTKLLDIPIEETCFVQMWLLRDNLDWHWRSQDAITTSADRKALYKRLTYFKDGLWVPDPGKDAKCQGIRFGAVRRPGNPGPTDPFNMNIILEWGPDEVLPITIDPDIQNPKV